jgi:hypothetical protein
LTTKGGFSAVHVLRIAAAAAIDHPAVVPKKRKRSR